jgi:hypothetical protein
MSWFSRLWRKENEKDRCGAGFLRLPKRHSLTPACKIHDIEYMMARDGNQIKTRRTIDLEFLDNMLFIADTEYPRYTRWFGFAQSYIFYGLVRVVGKFIYKGE